MCVTNNSDLALRLQLIRNHGEAVVEDIQFNEDGKPILGFNFRLGEMEAAIGRSQLKKLPHLNESRIRIANYISKRLQNLTGLALPIPDEKRNHVYYIYMMRVLEEKAGLTRSQLVQSLNAENLQLFEGYCRPLYLQALYKHSWPGKQAHEYTEGTCPNAELLFSKQAFFHSYLYEAVEHTAVIDLCDAIERIWDNRDQIAGVVKNEVMSVRRA